MPQRIILVRHGETPYNAEKKFIGWQTNVGLSENGRQQARAVAKNLAGYTFDAMYHSDLRRTRETASIISSFIKHRSQPEMLLRERNLATFADKTLQELKSETPELVEQFFDHANISWKVPGGESLAEVHARFRTLLAKLHSSHADQTVLLVTHSGYLHIVLRDIFGFFPTETMVEVEHDSLTILEKDQGTYKLALYNQVSR